MWVETWVGEMGAATVAEVAIEGDGDRVKKDNIP